MARRGDGIYQRGKTWWLDFMHRGERHVARLGKNISRTVAGELARVERAAVLKGEAGIGKPAKKDIVFEKAAEQFSEWAKTNRRPKTARCYAQAILRLKESFAGMRLGDIDPLSVERHKRTRIKAKAPIAANRELATLRALINKARTWGLYEGGNPVSEVKIPRERPGRLRFLDAAEETALLDAAEEPFRTVILVGVHAGLRIQAEALTLQWADVNLERALLTVQAAYAKNGEMRTVPLNSTLLGALRALRDRAGDAPHVFTRRDKKTPLRSIRTVFATACTTAGLKDVTPHVLRHTFASRLAMAGVDLRTIQELGGWQKLEMVERYSHLSPSHKAEAIERIARNSPTLFTTRGAVVPLAIATK
jgi:integrase